MVYPEILPPDGDFSALDAELIRILHKVHLGHLLKSSLQTGEEVTQEGTKYSSSNSSSSDGDSDDTAEATGTRPAQPVTLTKVYGHQYTLDCVVNWGEVLSGGEKQRLSLARYLSVVELCMCIC